MTETVTKRKLEQTSLLSFMKDGDKRHNQLFQFRNLDFIAVNSQPAVSGSTSESTDGVIF